MNAFVKAVRKRVADLCRRYGIARLSVFGSALGDHFAPESDVDFLVEFLPGIRAGFLRLAEIEVELSDIIGRKADLRTPDEISPYFRQEVLDSSEVLYVTG